MGANLFKIATKTQFANTKFSIHFNKILELLFYYSMKRPIVPILKWSRNPLPERNSWFACDTFEIKTQCNCDDSMQLWILIILSYVTLHDMQTLLAIAILTSCTNINNLCAYFIVFIFVRFVRIETTSVWIFFAYTRTTHSSLMNKSKWCMCLCHSYATKT